MVDRAHQTDERYERALAQKARQYFQRLQLQLLGFSHAVYRSVVSASQRQLHNFTLHTKAFPSEWKPDGTVRLRSN